MLLSCRCLRFGHWVPADVCSFDSGFKLDVSLTSSLIPSYQEMGTTKERRSVVVPYEAPQPGTDEYRVSYRFCCMNTCVGGINRRRLVVLFTLEDNR